MFRTNSHQYGFGSVERVALVTHGAATASSPTPQNDTPNGYSLDLNGTLHGYTTFLRLDTSVPLSADAPVSGRPASYFDTSGRISDLGKVSGSFGLNNAMTAGPDQLPNLSKLTLDLSNHEGSVRLTLAPSTSNHYTFRISGGAGRYADAHGSGSLTLSFRPGSNEYLLRLQSAKI